jgi:hypothetical protein
MPITPLEVSRNILHFDKTDLLDDDAPKSECVIRSIDLELSDPVRSKEVKHRACFSWKRSVFYELIHWIDKPLSKAEQERICQAYYAVGWKRIDVKNIDEYQCESLLKYRVRLFP